MRKTFLLAATLALLGAGCMAQPAPAPTPAPVPETPAAAPTTPTPPPGTQLVKPKTVTVEMKDNMFSPQIVAINPGDTVVWKNVGKNNHTTTGIGNPLIWDSGNIAPGKSYSRKFTATGQFEYHCGIHDGMTGTVVVGKVQPLQ